MVSLINKAVYLLEGSNWPNKLLLNRTTNKNGRAAFSLNTANLKADLNLVASANPEVFFMVLNRHTSLQIQVTVAYSFVGEAGSYSADNLYGVIILHGFQMVKAKAGDAVTSGSVTFQLSVSVDLAPAVQILVYSVLPSVSAVFSGYGGSCGGKQFLLKQDLCVVDQRVERLSVSLNQFTPVSEVQGPEFLCVRPCVRPSVRPSVRASVRSSVRPCVRPCVRPSVRASVRHKDLGAAEWSSHGVKSPNTSLPSLRWKKFVLPKFDVTVYAPQTYSVAVMGLKVESCAKCTYGQPVPGQALVEVCRDPFPYSLLHDLIRQCLTQTAKMNTTGWNRCNGVKICNGVHYKEICISLGGEHIAQSTNELTGCMENQDAWRQ
ncbi:pregnancy zone protein [Pimephales promelas]|nr:pregnancy zone protein [Pimephales promelas]